MIIVMAVIVIVAVIVIAALAQTRTSGCPCLRKPDEYGRLVYHPGGDAHVTVECRICARRLRADG